MVQTVLSIAVIVAALILIAIPMAIRDRKIRQRKIDAAFADRAPLDEPTFYSRYFMARGVPEFIVVQVRRILEDELGADLSRLSAEDDLTKNLSFFFEHDSLAGVAIVERLEEEFHIKISDAEATKTHTVKDIVNLVWIKLGGTA